MVAIEASGRSNVAKAILYDLSVSPCSQSRLSLAGDLLFGIGIRGRVPGSLPHSAGSGGATAFLFQYCSPIGTRTLLYALVGTSLSSGAPLGFSALRPQASLLTSIESNSATLNREPVIEQASALTRNRTCACKAPVRLCVVFDVDL